MKARTAVLFPSAFWLTTNALCSRLLGQSRVDILHLGKPENVGNLSSRQSSVGVSESTGDGLALALCQELDGGGHVKFPNSSDELTSIRRLLNTPAPLLSVCDLGSQEWHTPAWTVFCDDYGSWSTAARDAFQPLYDVADGGVRVMLKQFLHAVVSSGGTVRTWTIQLQPPASEAAQGRCHHVGSDFRRASVVDHGRKLATARLENKPGTTRLRLRA